MGLRSMRALAFDDHLKLVTGSHHRTRRHAKTASRHARPVMHAKHRFHWIFLEQTVIDHALRAAAAFFSRLENQIDGTVEITVLRQMMCRTKQHRGMPV